MLSPGEELLALCAQAEDEVVLVAPFVKRAALEQVLAAIPVGGPTIRCVARWRPEEIAAGACDVEIFDVVQQRSDARLFIHPMLHAKYFRVDGRCLLGSANLTHTALGWKTPANLELLLEAPAETPRLRAFEQTVLDVSFEASRTLRDQVAAAAEDLEARSPVTAVMSEESSVVSESEIVPDSEWLPLCGQPDKLYMVYADEGTDTMLGSTHLMGQKDLQRLQVPSGLPRGVFEKYVGAIIQQTPLVQQIREAAAGGRVTPQAGQDILTSLVDGQHLKHGPKARWETVRNWLLYFLPQEYRRPHGSDDLQRGVQIGSWPA